MSNKNTCPCKDCLVASMCPGAWCTEKDAIKILCEVDEYYDKIEDDQFLEDNGFRSFPMDYEYEPPLSKEQRKVQNNCKYFTDWLNSKIADMIIIDVEGYDGSTLVLGGK